MSAILAIYHRDGHAVDEKQVEKMLAAQPEHSVDGQRIWVNGSVALAHQHFNVAPEDLLEEQPLVDQSSQVVATCDGRLDNRAELILKLDLSPSEAHSLSDAGFILRTYLVWGTDCASQLLGEFAFAIWDARQNHLFLACDSLGSRRISYYLDNHLCLVASHIPAILAHPRVSMTLNEGKVGEYLAGIWHNPEESFFEDILYCPPAHWLLITPDSIVKWRYWQIDPDNKIRYRDEQAYGEHYLEVLRQAVACRLRCTTPIGISMSGGLDSTSIAALAATQLSKANSTGSRLKSYSYVFDRLTECDEREYIDPMVEQFDLDQRFIPSDDQWTLKNLEQWPALHEFVFGDPLAWLFSSVVDAAQQDGCRLLLSGVYGDALYHGDSYWIADRLFDLRLGSVFAEFKRTPRRIRWQHDLIDYGLRQLVPIRIKQLYRKFRPVFPGGMHPGLDPDFIDRAGILSRWQADKRWQTYKSPGQWERLENLTAEYWSQGYNADRVRYHSRGLELVYPYFDRRIVEFMMALPADQLGRPDRTKLVLRSAMKGILPEPVRERVGKTSYYPLVEIGLLDKEKGVVLDLLKDPQIVQRRLIRKDWLGQEIKAGDQWSNDGYYLWQSIALELWLKAFW